jgi:hypothetical protein
MFRKAMAAFDMTKLTKVEVVGEPEITREGVNAKIHVGVRVSPDMEQWRQFSHDLRAVLAAAATRRGAVARGPSGVELSRESPVVGQLAGNGMLIGLFSGNAAFAVETGVGGKSRLKSVATGGKRHGGPASSRGKSSSSNTSAGSTQWEMFRVPAVLEEALRETSRGFRYSLVCMLLDANGNDIVRTVVLRSTDSVRDGLGEVIYPSRELWLGDVWWLGPVWWREGHGKCMPVFQVETTLEISQDDLGKVAKTAVLLERDTNTPGDSSSDRRTKKRSVSSDDSRFSKKKSHNSGE